ncbi:MAG: hypothetical protein IRZ29_07505 [Thermoflavifilum sp.]|nr:hypothetical protein [Thermoflavifilum sp.]
MKRICWIACLSMYLLSSACGHAPSSANQADSAEVNIDSLLNQAKAAVDSLPTSVDSLQQKADSGK